jgi:hypothetical protein
VMELVVQFVEALVAAGAAAITMSLLLPPLMQSEPRWPAEQRRVQR